MVVCTFTLCLFLGFGKRRCELAVLGNTDAAAKHRATLAEYTPELLTLCLTISAGLALVTFLLYTMEPNPSTPFDKQTLRDAGFDEMRRIIREEEPPRPSARISTLQAEVITTLSQQHGSDPRPARHDDVNLVFRSIDDHVRNPLLLLAHQI